MDASVFDTSVSPPPHYTDSSTLQMNDMPQFPAPPSGEIVHAPSIHEQRQIEMRDEPDFGMV